MVVRLQPDLNVTHEVGLSSDSHVTAMAATDRLRIHLRPPERSGSFEVVKPIDTMFYTDSNCSDIQAGLYCKLLPVRGISLM
jgi:hypothetical protein